MTGPAEVVLEHGGSVEGEGCEVVGPPGSVVGTKMLLVVAPPGNEEVVAPGTVLVAATVVVGHGPTPPPGSGQSTWNDVVVKAGEVDEVVGPGTVVVGPVAQPSLRRREAMA